MNGKATVKIIKEFCIKNAPTILTCVGIAELLVHPIFGLRIRPKRRKS